MELGLTDRVAIVTGGGGPGNGGHIARTLAAEGATVVVVDRIGENATARVDEIRKAGGAALALVADATSWEEAQRTVQETLDAYGRLDVLVNSAYASTPGLFGESAPSDWARDIEGCLVAALNYCRACLEPMQGRQYGRIVNIVSDAGRIGEPRVSVYSGAKAGIIGFSKAFAKEVARYGITVNNVAPNLTERENVATAGEFWGRNPEERTRRRAAAMRAHPLSRAYGRIGRPQDVANAVTFLSSAAAAWITGQTLSVSGGYAMP